MTPEEIEQFVNNGCGMLAVLAQSSEQLKKWSDSFEQRGGQPVFGNDAIEIVYLSNDLQAWLTPERMATISRLRTDI